MDGFINLYKPKNFTSHDALNMIRRHFRGTKIGHGGTLDPDAVGVLPVCLGKGTKLQELVMGQTKAYETDVIFGLDSLSLDMSGDYTVSDEAFVLDQDKLAAVLKQFLGAQTQLPPVVSAIKQQGVPLYKLARKGQAVETAARPIVIKEITLKEVHAEEKFPRVRIAVECAKGTYIRALGRDIGAALGTTAIIDKLVRTASGEFQAKDAYTLEEIAALCAKKDYSFVIPLDFAVRHMACHQAVDGADWKAVLDGNELKTAANDGEIAIYDMSNELIGVGEAADGLLKPKKILWETSPRKTPLAEYNGFDEYREDDEVAVVIGNFDGVHLGHRYLIEHCQKAAAGRGLKSLVLSFYPHPKAFFSGADHWYLRTQAEKRRIVAGLGVDRLLTVAFDASFAAVSAETFVAAMLKEKLHTALVYVGEDFSFGKGGGATAADLKEICADYGIEVVIVPKLNYRGEAISSSRIKSYLSRGDVVRAAKLLGGAYELRGEVVHGNELGRTIGFPTANLNFPGELFIPKAGVYIAYARYGGIKHEAVASIGQRPTVREGLATNLEVYIMDDSPDLYGKELTVTLVNMIREEQKFDSFADLKAAIDSDVAEAQKFFQKRRQGPCNQG